ncbi:hypothetical protein WOLCODRAFT_131710 [Wolfiporia cocos MD-104 SS10]|uniref:F-box domain-containing protein n=1 Tax=Wolfiporia cocos (strain MD-104) TaxID=742152 RepID=A0A2H3JG01_WOLCO|nr:hypothetical protein WOLCODRAFT_131710 [Wolfiporia cocos MD-104 SS10]
MLILRLAVQRSALFLSHLTPLLGIWTGGVVNVRGISVIAFCSTITSPGLQQIGKQVRKMIIDFDDVRPTRAGLELVSAALSLLTNLTDLTLMGLPSDNDGWILRGAPFSLDRFVTNLPLVSKDVLDFLARQPNVTELGTTSPPPHTAQPQPQGTYQYYPFPNHIAPRLTTLDCPAPFLLSLLAATPPTRPLTSLRVDLNRMHSLVEGDALTALALFSGTVERLSLRRSVLRTSPISDSMVAMNMASVISRVATKRHWPKLRFLEMRDGKYNSTTIPSLAQSISTCFPHVEVLVWAPASHPAGSKVVAPFIASIFFTFCRSLRRFVFLEDASDLQNKKFVSVVKQEGGQCRGTSVDAEDVENMWRSNTF